MADDRIRIDALNPTVLPSLDHVVPAMHDGLTVKLTIAQLRAVMLGGASNVALALKDLSNTVGPRGVLGATLTAAGDYNALTENGVWLAEPGAAHAPEATRYYSVRSEVPANPSNVTQFARAINVDSSVDSFLWKRECNSGVWSSWYRVRENEAELDARYALASALAAYAVLANNLSDLPNKDTALTNLGGNANGRSIFKNATATGLNLALAPDTATARANIAVPLSPPSGSWTAQTSVTGTPQSLPAGGTWAYMWWGYNVTDGTITQAMSAAVAAGGSLISGGIANVQTTALMWKIV